MSDPAGIKSCKGLYSLGDVARYYGVSRTTVWNIQNGVTHRDVRPAEEPPRIESTRVRREYLREDWPVLKERGMSKAEAAAYLGVSKSTLYLAIREVAA